MRATPGALRQAAGQPLSDPHDAAHQQLSCPQAVTSCRKTRTLHRVTANRSPHETDWARWLRRELHDRGWQPIELSRRSNGRIATSQPTRWLRKGRVPDPASISVVCDILGVPAIYGMVAAGHLPADAIGATLVQQPDLTTASTRRLLEELARRLPAQADPGQRDDLGDRRRAQAGQQFTEDPDGLYDPDVILGPPADDTRSTGTGNPQN